MYIRRLAIRNLKLLRDVDVSFSRRGEPRGWTVFVGENGLCKTTILQAIALAASGPERATQLADVASLPDRRRPDEPVHIDACFSFGRNHHPERLYPGLAGSDPGAPDRVAAGHLALISNLVVRPGFKVVQGLSGYLPRIVDAPVTRLPLPEAGDGEPAPERDPGDLYPLSEARARNLPFWFAAGYGVERALPMPMSAREHSDPVRDRLLPLFRPDRPVIGTGFADLFPAARARAFVDTLRAALVDGGILPHVSGLHLGGRGGAGSAGSLIESHRFTMEFEAGGWDVPATWLSQGYQATIAWIADLIGQVWWEADREIAPADMEGLVLVDELDLHLHPKWQALLVPALKRVFPAMQFVATTHSPMLLPGLEQDEIKLLARDDSGNVVVRDAPESPALMTGSEIYQSFFELGDLYPRQVGEAVHRYGYLASNPFRSDAEEDELRRIEEILAAHGVEPGWTPVPRRALADVAASGQRAAEGVAEDGPEPGSKREPEPGSKREPEREP